MRRLMLLLVPGLCLLFGTAMILQSGAGRAGTIHPEFQRTWERTDRPVSTGDSNRTWMWGPSGHTDAFMERYDDADGGYRLVQYFDKSRMEVTDPDADPDDLWYVTNGLLAQELITGQMQVGDSLFETRMPADVQIAGDAHPDSPTYASFLPLLDAAPGNVGDPVISAIASDGDVTDYSPLAEFGVAHSEFVPETDKTIASVFWAFMNSSGTLFLDGQTTTGQVFENPFFGVGFPVTNAYWVHVPVGGEWQDVLVQCFERRCLTYTPSNPEGWQVEAGNIGQHYYTWRYETEDPDPGPADPDPVDDPVIPDDAKLGQPVAGHCVADQQARLSAVSDDHGNINPNSWARGTFGDWPGGDDATPDAAVGEQRTFSISASGDCGDLEFRVQRYGPDGTVQIIRNWSSQATFSYTFREEDAGVVMLIVDVRNQDPRRHFDDRDDYTYLTYRVN
jgi:hypothetical protein